MRLSKQKPGKALNEKILTSGAASSLRGKSRWCLCPVFGRVGMAAVQALAERQHSNDTALTKELEDALRLLIVLMKLLPTFSHRFKRQRLSPPAGVVFTDASYATDHKWLGFLVCCPIRGGVWAGSETPPWLLKVMRLCKERDTYIGQLEAIMIPAVYGSLKREWFQGRSIMHYIDNQGALYSMIKGRSKDRDINRYVFLARMKLLDLSCNAWFDYVPSAANMADLPTRLDDEAFTRLNRVARRVPLMLPSRVACECALADLAELLISNHPTVRPVVV